MRQQICLAVIVATYHFESLMNRLSPYDVSLKTDTCNRNKKIRRRFKVITITVTFDSGKLDLGPGIMVFIAITVLCQGK